MKGVLVILGAALLALVSIVLIFAACSPAKKEPARGPSIGYGNPGEPCATNRVGESFELNGITYVCSGPKPYRWRAQK